MSATVFRVAVCIALLTGVLGLPFAIKEEANQFLGLKRQTPSSKHWDPAISKDAWDLTIPEMVKESWEAVKKSAQSYWNSESSAAEVNISGTNLRPTWICSMNPENTLNTRKGNAALKLPCMKQTLILICHSSCLSGLTELSNICIKPTENVIIPHIK
ncbi:uncharacterized protein C3orf85 homolog [Varanus komodoensis]|uniref:uncharacterized protein C3orf85 homolog n=1 Tax=Varanus komodoensis TaxID=61221 RepID=UPI001CF7D329|nr:uncharacterized protein C3orf85 homolog [Varanus komodoensis]